MKRHFLYLMPVAVILAACTVEYIIHDEFMKKFTVTFNSNNGSDVDPQTVTTGKQAQAPTPPTRTGYEFKGWFTDNGNFTYAWNFATTAVTGDITLYAKWEKLKYSVIFNSNGSSQDPATQDIEYGEKVNQPADPTKKLSMEDIDDEGLYLIGDDLEFGGWYENGASAPFDFELPLTGEITLTAKWKKPNAINFNMENNIIYSAIEHVNGIGFATEGKEYVLALINNVDYTSTTSHIVSSYFNLKITGLGNKSIIINVNLPEYAYFAYINNSFAKLTIGNNITLNGITEEATYSMILINAGTFTMEPGSIIKGHKTKNDNGVILCYSGGLFNMKGGEISNNETTSNEVGATGGVKISGGTFNMSGGEITGNTAGVGEGKIFADVFFSYGKVTLSSTAQIGYISLYTTGDSHSPVKIESPFTGNANINIGRLNPKNYVEPAPEADTERKNNIIEYWKEKQVLEGAAADIAKFTLGYLFTNKDYSIQTIVRYQIGAQFILDSEGKLTPNGI